MHSCRSDGDMHMLKRKLHAEACPFASEKSYTEHVPADPSTEVTGGEYLRWRMSVTQNGACA
jgi:hypothetical protein